VAQSIDSHSARSSRTIETAPLTEHSPPSDGERRRPYVEFGAEVLVNFVLPFALYAWLQSSVGDVGALMISTVPPLAWSIFEFVRRRRIDALSLLVLTGILLSLVAFFGGGSVQFLQLRENLVTGLVGLLFLGSVAIGRPLIYYLARASMHRQSPSKASRFAALRDDPAIKRAMRVMTLAWGVALVGQCALASSLVFTLSIEQYLVVSPIVGYALLGAMTVWSFAFARRRFGAAMGAKQ
jgi:hypothetical protein